ncbi:MAG: hypothetical protein J5I47_05610 [Vicingus serpentipes]|nr:hypothetical protein [Vicingus serpentipes]
MRTLLHLIIYISGLIAFLIYYNPSEMDANKQLLIKGAFVLVYTYLIIVELTFFFKKAQHIKIGNNLKGKLFGTSIGVILGWNDMMGILDGNVNFRESTLCYVGLLIIIISWVDSNYEIILFPNKMTVKKQNRKWIKKADITDIEIDNREVTIIQTDKKVKVQTDDIDDGDKKKLLDWLKIN